MDAKACQLEVVFTATWDWLQIAEAQGFAIDWDSEPIDSEWDIACGLCGFDPEDTEVGFAVLDRPRPQDTLLRPGDVIGTNGHGSDIVIFRMTETD